MTTKEKVIRESIKRATKRLEKVKSMLAANPLSEICDVRKQAHEIMIEHEGDAKKIVELIAPLADKEKKLFTLAKKQMKHDRQWISEQVELEVEIGDLTRELFYIKNTPSF